MTKILKSSISNSNKEGSILDRANQEHSEEGLPYILIVTHMPMGGKGTFTVKTMLYSSIKTMKFLIILTNLSCGTEIIHRRNFTNIVFATFIDLLGFKTAKNHLPANSKVH